MKIPLSFTFHVTPSDQHLALSMTMAQSNDVGFKKSQCECTVLVTGQNYSTVETFKLGLDCIDIKLTNTNTFARCAFHQSETVVVLSHWHVSFPYIMLYMAISTLLDLETICVCACAVCTLGPTVRSVRYWALIQTARARVCACFTFDAPL